MIMEFEDFFSNFLCNNFNQCLSEGSFPNVLKIAEVHPIFKKDSRTNKENYRPVSILSNISKIYERCMYEQIYEYFDQILSKFQCGFRKGHSAQHCLLVMIEKFRRARDMKSVCAAILTDLSKAFDCICHDLLIAKLNAYGFDKEALMFLSAYLSNRTQKTKIGSCFSEMLNILFGVPQGSILGPLLFCIFLCDLFFVISDVDFANYADDTTPYVCKKHYEKSINEIEKISNELFDWFSQNHFKANASKSHFFLTPYKNSSISIKNTTIPSSKCETLLGVKIDSELNFEQHILTLCRKANQKVHALNRVANYMSFDKKRNVMKAFITSQFSYCPLVWMIHSRTLNNKINRIHERALRLVYPEKHLSFEELLEKDKSVSIHMNNIHYLAIEIYKVNRGLAPELLNEIFKFETNPTYNLRSGENLKTTNPRTTCYGTESITSLGAKIWNLIPKNIKELPTLALFKKHIKQWKPNCPCRLCKVYIKGVGFI